MKSFKDWCIENNRKDLLDEWDISKNSDIDPNTISATSGKSVWWLKHYDDPNTGKHFVFEWKTTISVRTIGNSRCPYLINYKIMKGFNDLATLHPELVNEWHPFKNGSLTPYEIGVGSGKQIWWLKHYDDLNTGKHFEFEWRSTINDRLRYGCPYLSKPAKKVYPGFNDFLTLNPKLKDEWDYDRNIGLLPESYSSGSGEIVFWKCKNGHSYKMRINHRANGHGCPYCAGQKVISGEDDLITINPDFLKEWDYERNVGIDPSHYKLHSNKNVWWKCEMGHNWKTTISHRAEGSRCPHCYKEYGTSFAEQAILFYLKQDYICENRSKLFGKEIDIYLPELKIGFEYDGIAFHTGKKNKLKEENKNLVLSQNGIKLYRIKESDKNFYDVSNKIIFCIPDRKYQYLSYVLTQIYSILNKPKKIDFDLSRDSSLIYNEYVNGIKQNNIATLYPEILEEWDYEKNGKLNPEFFLPHSQKKVWWKCKKCGSSYLSDFGHMSQGNRCPYCAGKKVNSTNSLAGRFPELLKFWDYSKNTIDPNSVYFSSRKKVWWICEKCGRSYQTALCQRIKLKTNLCFDCFHKNIGLKNREISLRRSGSVFDDPSLIVDWDYRKNTFNPKEIAPTSGEYAYWKCHKCGFEWKAKIINRHHGTGCPVCRNEESHKKHCKIVEQYDLDGNLIASYSSVRDAINKSGVSSLMLSLSGKKDSVKGYRFKYKNGN